MRSFIVRWKKKQYLNLVSGNHRHMGSAWTRLTSWTTATTVSHKGSPPCLLLNFGSMNTLRVSLLLSPSKKVARAASSLRSTPVVPQPTVNSTLIRSSFWFSSPSSLRLRKCFESAGLLLSSCSDTPWTSSSLKYICWLVIGEGQKGDNLSQIQGPYFEFPCTSFPWLFTFFPITLLKNLKG